MRPGMFSKILIANRGEIACRIMRTAKAMGCRCVAVYSDADRHAMHVEMADEAYRLGPAPVAASYLRIDRIIAAAQAGAAQAVHPGYGLLSENPEFAQACGAAGLVFIGPPAAAIRAMGRKDAAKEIMRQAQVPVVPGYHGPEQDAEFLAARAAGIGYPALIKARAGGGGKGIRRVDGPADFAAALEGARREGESSFGDGRVLVEKFILAPRHIEVQIFADSQGQRDPPVRARLLAAAAPSKGDRRSARPRHDREDENRHGSGGGAGGQGGRLCGRGNSGVHRRRIRRA